MCLLWDSDLMSRLHLLENEMSIRFQSAVLMMCFKVTSLLVLLPAMGGKLCLIYFRATHLNVRLQGARRDSLLNSLLSSNLVYKVARTEYSEQNPNT